MSKNFEFKVDVDVLVSCDSWCEKWGCRHAEVEADRVSVSKTTVTSATGCTMRTENGNGGRNNLAIGIEANLAREGIGPEIEVEIDRANEIGVSGDETDLGREVASVMSAVGDVTVIDLTIVIDLHLEVGIVPDRGIEIVGIATDAMMIMIARSDAVKNEQVGMMRRGIETITQMKNAIARDAVLASSASYPKTKLSPS